MDNLITPQANKIYKLHHGRRNLFAKFLRESSREGYKIQTRFSGIVTRRGYTHYVFLNLATGREILIKSRVKIICEVEQKSA